jgi:hypothetical protein
VANVNSAIMDARTFAGEVIAFLRKVSHETENIKVA